MFDSNNLSSTNKNFEYNSLRNSNLKFSNLKVDNLPISNFLNKLPKEKEKEPIPIKENNNNEEKEKLQKIIDSLNLKIIALQGQKANDELIHHSEKKRLNLKITKLQEGIAFMKKEYGDKI